MSAAMLPPAPGLFSITTVWPQTSCRRLPMRRAVMSVEPPGVNGTTMRTGFAGQSALTARDARMEGAAGGGLAGIQPAEADRKTLAAEQRDRFIERQANDVAVGADHLDHERSGDALHRVAAGFAAPFAGADIGLDVVLAEPLETHAGFDQALAERLLRRHQADRGVDAVIAPRQQPQALRGFIHEVGLGQDAAADRDHRIGGQNEG